MVLHQVIKSKTKRKSNYRIWPQEKPNRKKWPTGNFRNPSPDPDPIPKPNPNY